MIIREHESLTYLPDWNPAMPKKPSALSRIDQCYLAAAEALDSLLEEDRKHPSIQHLRTVLFETRLASMWITCPAEMAEAKVIGRKSKPSVDTVVPAAAVEPPKAPPLPGKVT